MKKRAGIMLSAILASTMVLTPVYATESIDLDSMSVEDLVALKDAIEEKIDDKKGDESVWETIPRGTYKVGTDIKAGQFEFEAVGGITITVFESEEKYKANKKTDRYTLGYSEEEQKRNSAFLSLSDGQVLTIDFGTGLIREAPKASWMPD